MKNCCFKTEHAAEQLSQLTMERPEAIETDVEYSEVGQ
jgi:hypothetical protein